MASKYNNTISRIMKVLISRAEFGVLYEAIKEKYIAACKSQGRRVPTSDASIIGASRTSEYDRMTITSLMLMDSRVQNYLMRQRGYSRKTKSKFSAGVLYRSFLNFKSGKQQLSLDTSYVNAYCIFLGFKDRDDFLQQFNRKLIHYRGFFLSASRQGVWEFELSLSKIPGNELAVTIIGILDHIQNKTLTGTAAYLDRILKIDIKDERHFVSIAIGLDSFNGIEFEQSQGYSLMSGVMSCSTSFPPYVSASPCFLLRVPENLGEKETIAIRRCLNLSRGPIDKTIRHGVKNTFRDLEIGGVRINHIEHIAGIRYRVLISRGRYLFQSQFTINQDFSASIVMTVSGEVEKHECLLSINYDRLTIYAVGENQSDILSIAFMEMPRGMLDEIIWGSFCQARRYKLPAFSGKIVMIEDRTNFEAGKYTYEECIHSGNKKLQILATAITRVS